MSEKAMIDIQGLRKRYPRKDPESSWIDNFRASVNPAKRKYIDALDDVDLRVRKGEVIGILGPNGAGKTTMLKVMAGFLYPDAGSVKINGLDVIEDRHEVRCSCNFLRSGGWVIFDYKYPLDKLLEFWGVFMGLRRKEAVVRAGRALDVVGLGEKKKEFTENLSAGMRQKLNLARCLMIDRPIYLLDEPTSNIDPYSGEFIRDFVRNKLARKGVTVIIATHNLWEAEKLCDRVVILDKGKVVRVGTADEIRRQTADEVMILDFTGQVDELASRLMALDKVVNVTVSRDPEVKIDGTHRLSVYGKDIHRGASDIMDIARDLGQVGYLDIQTPSLNDIFMQLMKEREDEAR